MRSTTQLAITAAVASAISIGSVLAYQDISRRQRRRKLKEEVLKRFAEGVESGGESSHHGSRKNDSREQVVYEHNEDITREQLARNYAFFGEDGMAGIRNGRVVVVGCGGVGSWASVMLVRSVSYIRLVDFDYVTLSSLNRHASATLADVGTPKVKCVEKTLKSIANWITVDPHVELWRKEDGADLLSGVDWVVDAIDNINTKVDLLHYCHTNGIKVFASMGAGAKSDPTRIQISDISNTVYDPLARSVRRRLRALGVASGIPVVYSTETPGDVKLLPLPEEEFQKGPVKELGVLDDFRVRILPSLDLFQPILNPLAIRGRKKLYEKLLAALLVRESKLAGHQINKLPIDEEDVSFIFEDLHRGRSVVPPHDVPARPVLLRWDVNAPLTLENCVVMDAREAALHVQEEKIDGEKSAEAVERRVEEIQQWRSWIM